MNTVGAQILNVSDAISSNIASLGNQRALLAQNILSQLRNLVEGTAVLLHKGSPGATFDYPSIEPALAFVKGRSALNFLGRFHGLLQASASHYTLDGDASERLMLKYCEYLFRIRRLLESSNSLSVLANLEAFPVDLDPSLREYHEKIAARIAAKPSASTTSLVTDRYYIHKSRSFYVGGAVYYEVTFFRAINHVSKFDRIIGFTALDLAEHHAVSLTIRQDSIESFGQRMPITIITDWEVSIRPCEFDNFARCLGKQLKTRTNSLEYRTLMHWLKSRACSLLELIDVSDTEYAAVRDSATEGVGNPMLFCVLDQARTIAKKRQPGSNIVRYLMLRMCNQVIKAQHSGQGCEHLSGMHFAFGCIPFDVMPFCTSLPDHNPRYWDLLQSIPTADRSHELLARRVKINVERHKTLYTSLAEVERFGDVATLQITHNSQLYYKHSKRRLVVDKGHIFIQGYEEDTISIIKKLQEYSIGGIDGYAQAVDKWLCSVPGSIDDLGKAHALRELFSQSRVAVIYGAAGTGKSTMVNHIARFFNDRQKLFAAHTNPAIDNLRRKVTAQRADFKTIHSLIRRGAPDIKCDILVVDECSTVSNADMLKLLETVKPSLIVLVGDIYQIEAIQFGNWFGIIKAFIPSRSIFELDTPFRSTNQSLLSFWNKVRNIDADIAECISRNGYSSKLDDSLFKVQDQDEIILCLNYDGLYGINNVNRFLQSSNSGKAANWRDSTFKVGDPILFHDTERFRPVIYNNLKGRIVAIESGKGRIQFDVQLDRPLTEFDVKGCSELQWLGNATVRFSVYDYANSDEDNDDLNNFVPFQVAYAVSIHKAQGLEYEAVKIVITDANEDDISHSIFYTAITRARKSLRIFWTPETQRRILESLKRNGSIKDVSILACRCGLTPISR